MVLAKGASKAVGMRSIAADLGFKVEIEVLTDATAAIGICRRRGLGKIRHLAVADLWIQDRVKAKDFILTKVLGSLNPSDILTKHTDRATLEKHLTALDLMLESGRPKSAPALTH